MKKLFLVILLVSFSFLFISCSAESSNNSQIEQFKGDASSKSENQSAVLNRESKVQSGYVKNMQENNLLAEIKNSDDYKSFISNTVEFGPYKWRILEVRNDSILIITDEIIDYGLYDDTESFTSVTWETSTIRDYLNNGFLNQFSDAEKALILETELENDENFIYHTSGGNNTIDKIFLLSIFEASYYFKEEYEDRMAYKASNVFSDFGDSIKNVQEIGEWWLRSPGEAEYFAAYIPKSGKIDVKGFTTNCAAFWNADNPNGYTAYNGLGIRPALNLKFDIKELTTVHVKDEAGNIINNVDVQTNGLRCKDRSDDVVTLYLPKDGDEITISKFGYQDATLKIEPNNKEYDVVLSLSSDYTVGDEIEFGPYSWIVLNVKNDSALLLCKDTVNYLPYNDATVETDVTWEQSSIRKYLNNEFIDQFSNSDKYRIADTNVVANTNQKYGTDGGNSTVDKVFLLSVDEVDDYDLYVKYVASEDWWLRTPGIHQSYASVFTNAGGGINGFCIGMDATWDNGVRPVLNLRF